MSIKLTKGFVVDAQGRLLGPGATIDHLRDDLLQSLINEGRTEGKLATKKVDEVEELADVVEELDELPAVDVAEAVEPAPAKPKTSGRSRGKSK